MHKTLALRMLRKFKRIIIFLSEAVTDFFVPPKARKIFRSDY